MNTCNTDQSDTLFYHDLANTVRCSGQRQRQIQIQRRRRQTIHQGFVLALLDQQYPRIQHSAQQSNKHRRLFLEPEWPAYHSYSHHLQYGYHSLDVFSNEVTNSLRENKQVRMWRRNGIDWRLNYMKMVEVFFFSIMILSARECLLALIIPKRSVERDQPH